MKDEIICDDVLLGLSKIPDNSVHLIITSPPFNVKINYDNYTDNLSHKEYLAWTNKIWSECKRVLIPGGRICINIDATTNLEEDSDFIEKVHPLHVDFTNQIRDLGYIYRAEINWCKQNAPSGGAKWGSYCSPSNPHIRRNTEYIIVASKGSMRLEGDSMMSDITKEEFHAWTLSEWRINPETNKEHPAPFPRELVKRCIKLFSYVGNIVLDPFVGSGTTISTAIELGRHYIGIDKSQKYCDMAKNACNKAKSEINMANPEKREYVFIPSPILVKEGSFKKKSRIDSYDMYNV